jgi:diadenosine tetraphosphate (Ap4A) HIT family hydrolase
MTFSLHPQLAADTFLIGDLKHCRLLLMNNSNFPWLIMVPRGENLRELFDLSPEIYREVMDEVRHVAEQFAAYTKADKINIAALGNMVPQLHIHIIARYKNDAAWPAPVWNSPTLPKTYESQSPIEIITQIQRITNL